MSTIDATIDPPDLDAAATLAATAAGLGPGRPRARQPDRTGVGCRARARRSREHRSGREDRHRSGRRGHRDHLARRRLPAQTARGVGRGPPGRSYRARAAGPRSGRRRRGGDGRVRTVRPRRRGRGRRAGGCRRRPRIRGGRRCEGQGEGRRGPASAVADDAKSRASEVAEDVRSRSKDLAASASETIDNRRLQDEGCRRRRSGCGGRDRSSGTRARGRGRRESDIDAADRVTEGLEPEAVPPLRVTADESDVVAERSRTPRSTSRSPPTRCAPTTVPPATDSVQSVVEDERPRA